MYNRKKMILNGSKGCFAVYYKDLLLSSIPVYKDHKIIWEKYLQRTNKIIIQNLKKGGTIKDVINFIVWFLIVGIGSVGLLMLGALLDKI